MISLSLEEAQLFKILASFFGREHVVPQMSVVAVCGGALPAPVLKADKEIEPWAKKNKCLFTIVDKDDSPKMVIEFFSGFSESVDVVEEEHQRFLIPLLKAVNVHYVTISQDEFEEILNPHSTLDIVTLLRAKFDQEVGVEIASEGADF